MSFTCPTDGTELVKARSGLEYVGEGWNRAIFYYEEKLCPKCKLRVKFRGLVVNLGGGIKNIEET